jgi:hypothetical protein
MAGTSLADQPASAWLAALEQFLDPEARGRIAREAQAVLPPNGIAMQWPRWEPALQELVDRKKVHVEVTPDAKREGRSPPFPRSP